jgi:hypothetical protein
MIIKNKPGMFLRRNLTMKLQPLKTWGAIRVQKN